MPSKRNKVLQRHFDRIGDMPCCVSGGKPVVLHHCRDGSMVAAGVHTGGGQKSSDWLVIPLAPDYHTGSMGIHSPLGVVAWEWFYGEQVKHLDALCRELGYNCWKRAGVPREVEGVCSF